MTQVEQIIAEIKDRISYYQEWIDSGYDNGEKEKRQELKELLTFIDSLIECQQVSPVVSGDLKTIVDKESREVWNEINTGHDYSVIDSFSQFYGICIQMAECSANWQKQQTIDKAADFLNNKLGDVVATRVSGTIIPYHVAKQEVIKDLKRELKK